MLRPRAGSPPRLTTTRIMRGVEYEFVQHEMTNWMHPIGMAYYPDGALGYDQYAEVPELENPTPEDW